MSQPLRIGIVGAGLIAHVHAQTYQKCGAKIEWVYDSSPEAIAQYRKEFEFNVAPSVEALADRNKVDAVSVCSPAAFHLENCLPLIEARIPTLCEKPLAADLAGAEKLAAAIKKRNNLVFMVGFCHRFDTRVMALANLVRSGKLGRPILFRNMFGQWGPHRGNSNVDRALAGGGAMTGNGSHAIDLFRWIVGDPTRVQAMAGTLGQDLDVEDIGLIQLSIAEKTFGELATSFSTHHAEYTMEFYGTEGTAMINYKAPLPPVVRYRLADDSDWTALECPTRPDIFEGEVANFLDCVRSGATPAITVDDGLAAARILAAAYRSARTHQSVAL